MQDNVILSFLIPTHNRIDKLYKLVTEILKYEGDEIEIIVSNDSTDDTEIILNSIQDKRLRFFNRKTTAPDDFFPNCTGVFSMILLDKDYINSKYLPQLLELLKENQNKFALGKCSYNYNKYESDYRSFEKGFDTISAIGYHSQHPSGLIINNLMFKNNNLMENLKSYSSLSNGFPYDLLCADLGILGGGFIFNLPLCKVELRREARKQKSYTYKNGINLISKQQAFFTPSSRIKLAGTYLQHIRNINLTEREKDDLISQMFCRELSYATYGYKLLLKDKALCAHYDVKTRDMNQFEFIKIVYTFSIEFFRFVKKETSKTKDNYIVTVIKLSRKILAIQLKSYIKRIKNKAVK